MVIIKIVLLIIILTLLSFSNRSEDIDISKLKYDEVIEKDDYKNISYEGLNVEKRKNIDILIKIIENNRINLLNDLKNKYFIGLNKTSGEIFLEELDEETLDKIIFGLSYNYNYSKKEHNHIPKVFFLKNINKNANVLNTGIYTSYKNFNFLQENTSNIHIFNIGIDFETLISEYNFSFILLNEYNYIYNKNFDIKANNINGGAKISFQKYLGNIFYINPNLIFTYSIPISSTTKFNETNVNLNESFNFSIGGSLKLGIEKEHKDNLYNAYAEFAIDKLLKNKYDLDLKFKNQVSKVQANLASQLILLGSLGFDILIKKEHRLKLIGGINRVDNKFHYNLFLEYQLNK